MELRERLRADALALGFDQVGFAPAEPPIHADAYRSWLDRGWHGEMAYMAREDSVRRRLSPVQALPGCRSIIVTSLRYSSGGSGPGAAADTNAQVRAGSAWPIVARYASGRDYHLVFEELLGRLSAHINGLAPLAENRLYVDYGPVLERDHAQRAGLGWIGKNTMLINPRLGSYLLLGELLTTLELPPDEPFTADRCGTCRRCIEACPTDAIKEPERAVDARLCISYLTIELRGSIPEELRPAVGARVFGCDICQEVCPWNDVRDRTPLARTGDPEPEPGTSSDEGTVGDWTFSGRQWASDTMVEWASRLVEMTDEDFRELYGDTALLRPRRDGLLRNLCVGLGNSGGPAARGVLERCARDRSALVREHAEWALARLESQTRRPDHGPRQGN